MNHHIAAFQEAEYGQLVEIWFHAVRETHDFLPEADFRFYHELIRAGALREAELWVAHTEEGQASGFLGRSGNKVEMLFVHPARHGQGIGRALLEHAKGLAEGPLQVDVNEQNTQAVTFYRRYGFEQTGRSELDGAGKPFPLLHMELRR